MQVSVKIWVYSVKVDWWAQTWMAIVPAIYFGRGPVPCAGRVGAQIIGVPPHHILFSGLVFILIRDQLVLFFDLYFTNLIYLIIFTLFDMYCSWVEKYCCNPMLLEICKIWEAPSPTCGGSSHQSTYIKIRCVIFNLSYILYTYNHVTLFQRTLSSKSFESSIDSLLSV